MRKLKISSPAGATKKSGSRGKTEVREATEEECKKYLKKLKRQLKKQKKKPKKVLPRNFAAEKVQADATAKDKGERRQSSFATSLCGGSGLVCERAERENSTESRKKE